MSCFSLENPRGAAQFIHICLHFSSYMFTMCLYCCVHIAVFNMNVAVFNIAVYWSSLPGYFPFLSVLWKTRASVAWEPVVSKQIAVRKETSGTKKGKLLFMIFSIGKEQLLKLLFLLPQALLTSDVSYASRESKFLIVLLKSWEEHFIVFITFFIRNTYMPSPQILSELLHMENLVLHLGDRDLQGKEI